MEVLKKLLEKHLEQNLPGEKAQFKLAPETRPTGHPNDNTIEAGVLILIYPDEQGIPTTVFMKRPEYEGHHSAQISFPGGKSEITDKNIIETALRESFEEIGIKPGLVEVIGTLTPLFIPVSNFLVHPIIGFTKRKPAFILDKNEVDYLIVCPLLKLLKAEIKETIMHINRTSYNVPYYDINNEVIWGATSMIVSELIEVLNELDISFS